MMHPIFYAMALAMPLTAAEPEAASAKDLASRLSALQQDGSSYVRMKLEIKPAEGSKVTLQLQVKQRRSAKSTEIVYQVLWPKERAGEAVLLRQSGSEFSGATFTPPNTVKTLASGQIKDPLFGSALTYADVLEDFFVWSDQKIVGTEVVNKVSCQILESRSGKAGISGATLVRSWIDTKRVVPMRVEKYTSSGAVSRRIDTRNVASDDTDRNVPANLTIQDVSKGSSTDLEGSKLKHGVAYQNTDFTPEGLKDMSPR